MTRKPNRTKKKKKQALVTKWGGVINGLKTEGTIAGELTGGCLIKMACGDTWHLNAAARTSLIKALETPNIQTGIYLCEKGSPAFGPFTQVDYTHTDVDSSLMWFNCLPTDGGPTQSYYIGDGWYFMKV